MHEVLRASQKGSSESRLWLQIIDQFDRAAVERSSVGELASLAATASHRTAGVAEEWSGARVTVPESEADPKLTTALLAHAVTTRLRGRDAAALRVDGHAVLAASIEAGSGRLGIAWLLGPRATAWEPLDFLIVERLAAAVATSVLRTQSEKLVAGPNRAIALERLLQGGLDELETAQTVRSAQLRPGSQYVAVAIRQTPPNSVSSDGLRAIVGRAVQSAGSEARTTMLGSCVAAVAQASPAMEQALEGLARNREALGFGVQIGVGSPAPLADIDRSWREAREALALRSMIADDNAPAFFRDIGTLHLLAQIPREAVLSNGLFQRLVASLTEQSSPSDIDILEAYLDAGTLRAAAQRVYLHHTTIQHRLRRVEERLSVDLSDPAMRFRIGLLLKLYRIIEARDDTAGILEADVAGNSQRSG